MDSFEKAAIAYFGVNSLKELQALDFLKTARQSDRLGLAVELFKATCHEYYLGKLFVAPIHKAKAASDFEKAAPIVSWRFRSTINGSEYWLAFHYGD